MRRHDYLFEGTRKILTNSVVVTSGSFDVTKITLGSTALTKDDVSSVTVKSATEVEIVFTATKAEALENATNGIFKDAGEKASILSAAAGFALDVYGNAGGTAIGTESALAVTVS